MDPAMQHDQTSPAGDRIPIGELWRWLAPWLLGAFLIGAALLGLLTASRAQDDATYLLGFITAGVALLMLVWRVKTAIEGGGAVAPVLVDDPAALVIAIGLLAALAVGGLLLAARSGAAAPEAVGYGLFGFCLVFIFANLKHYFDGRDRDR
jgi:CDP-diglyceride synthetase